MAGMTSPPQATPQLPGKYPPFTLLYPWLTILVVVFLTVWLVGRLSVPHATAVRFNACVEKQIADNKKAAAPLTLQDVEKCESDEDKSFDDLVKAPIDELKWLLEIIGTLAGFFVIAQAGAAYFSAEVYSKQAERGVSGIQSMAADYLQQLQETGADAVTDLKKQIQDELAKVTDIQKGLRARYPIFQELEDQRSDAMAYLEAAVKQFARGPSAQPTEAMRWDAKWKLYAWMEVRDRQRILSLESFASIDLTPGPAGQEGWCENLRRYAIFYQSKFLYEQNMGVASFGDLERAEGYLRLARRKSPTDFTLLNDLGVLCLDIHKLRLEAQDPGKFANQNEYLLEARDLFRGSLALQPNQQRARYNLAVTNTVYEKPEDFTAAAEALKEALRQKNWQQFPPVDAVRALMFYNLGCYRAQILARGAPESSHLAPGDPGVAACLANLTEAAGLGTEGIEAIGVDSVERDCAWEPTASAEKQADREEQTEEGDLVGLYRKGDAELRHALEGIRDKLLESAAKSPKSVLLAATNHNPPH
jgi:tetratricopeptide (TPR) repeat protein